jgi:hypothetical protein
MSRYFRNEILIQVELDGAEQPLLFVWRKYSYLIDQITNNWRVDTEWWSTPISREYFEVITRSGLWVVIYRDRLTDTWFMQRLYD